ncbi:hypothetical protein [Natrialba aegyptia]|uniref:Uncharacterized protein n=1 Tax=Natrialba aegyptia DSM 13077 TaxID=1227491 RepID=M0AZG5_9EURY|nr:hypothetical protein [Natrialba aegyptia]ELZ03712.1 hypothetical protein C480_15145 [Natrialba aegyptia DSM 13077]
MNSIAPDISSLSRRQLLVGLAGSAELVVLVVSATAATLPTALPDRVTDWATTTYPTPPPASSLWQPTVTEAHARTAVTLLAETGDESRDRWAELDRERLRTGEPTNTPSPNSRSMPTTVDSIPDTYWPNSAERDRPIGRSSAGPRRPL